MISVLFEMSLRLLKIFLIFFSIKESFEVSFECDFKNRYWEYVGEIYSCYARDTIWNLDDPRVTSINGTHRGRYNNHNVKGFFIYPESESQYLKKLPENLHIYVPNLKAISIWPSKISHLSSNDFKYFPYLERLDFSNSKIVSIPGDLFKFNKKLKYIGFNFNNHFSNVGEEFLKDLKGLKKVDFSFNKCIDQKAETPEKIQELKKSLIEKCPPETDYCSSACSILNDQKFNDQQKIINDMKNASTVDQQKFIESLKKMIDDLQVEVFNQRVIIKDQKLTIEKQQKTIKDFTSLNAALYNEKEE
jgi:hypothetical protein